MNKQLAVDESGTETERSDDSALNLVVTYEDGREDVYKAPSAKFVLGSDSACDLGIQAPGVQGRHIVFSHHGTGLSVRNLQNGSTVRLNGSPLVDRRTFEIGDDLQVGTVHILLRHAAQAGKDLARSADGTSGVAEGVRTDMRSGWRGYRRILDKISDLVSPEEAETAQRWHTAGLRSLKNSLLLLLIIFAMALTAQSRQWFVLEAVLTSAAIYTSIISILLLTIRYRIRFAGRVVFLVIFALLFCSAPEDTWITYYETAGYGGLLLLAVSFCSGWLLDVGAGCIFYKKRSAFLWRYLLLIGSNTMLCGLGYIATVLEPSVPTSQYWEFPLLLVAALYPWWSRRVQRKWSEDKVDVSLVAELASWRMSTTFLSRCVTVLAVGAPLFFLLSSLGSREKLVWEDDDPGLVLSCGDAGATNAWYCGNKGGYLRKGDLDDRLIYQIPAESTDKAKELSSLVALVQAEPTNGTAYARLREGLAPYRVRSSDTGRLVDGYMNSARTFYLEACDVRRTYASGPDPKLYHAQTPLELTPQTRADAEKTAHLFGSMTLPNIVLLFLGGLFLWKRGGDSATGFWLGLVLVSSVLAFYSDAYVNLGGEFVQYRLWHWAVNSPVGSLAAGWYAFLCAAGIGLSVLAYIAMSVLFVLLCWPKNRMASGGSWASSLAFLGKVLVVFLFQSAFRYGGAAIAGAGLPDALSAAASLLTHLALIAILGGVGAWMRRTRRFDTEASYLGWEFFLGWLALDCAVLLPTADKAGVGALVPASWLAPLVGDMSAVSIVAGGCAVAGGCLFLRLCLKRDFLSVMTVNDFAMTLFAFSVPVFAELCESLTEHALKGSLLGSETGERILSISIIILFLSPLWKRLHKLSRQLSMRNLVRVESDVEETLEHVLDTPEGQDYRDEVFSLMKELGIGSFAFYAHDRSGASGTFSLLVSNGWRENSVDSFTISRYLRRFLGAYHRTIDFERMIYEKGLLFQSFELNRIAEKLQAGCLLPICLGKSVRAIVVTPKSTATGALPNSDVFIENVNQLGLATVATIRVPEA